MANQVKTIGAAWLTTNRSCNNRCRWCYAQETNFMGKPMKFKLATKLVELLQKLEVKKIVLIGGEPTLYPRLLDLVGLIKESGIRPVLITNGRMFANNEFAEMIVNAGLENIIFSVKGADKQQYLQLTRRDGYEEMIEGFRNLTQLGLQIPFSVTISLPLIKKMPLLIKNLLAIGARSFSFDLASPVIVNETVSTLDIPDPLQLAESCLQIDSLLKGNSAVDYYFYLTIPLCLLPKQARQEWLQREIITTSCQLQQGNGLVLDTEGEILPCNHFSSCSLGKYGIDFIDEKTFSKFWNSHSMNTLRSSFLTYPSKKCEGCKDWAICGGGCMVKWMHWNPSRFIT